MEEKVTFIVGESSARPTSRARIETFLYPPHLLVANRSARPTSRARIETSMTAMHREL